jgi:hypothetical protein
VCIFSEWGRVAAKSSPEKLEFLCRLVHNPISWKKNAGRYSKAPNSNFDLGIQVSLTCADGLLHPVVCCMHEAVECSRPHRSHTYA